MTTPKIRVTQRKVVWVDLHLHSRDKRAQRKMGLLLHEFVRWGLDEDILPVARGHLGPLGMSGGYTPVHAERIVAWFEARGFEVEAL